MPYSYEDYQKPSYYNNDYNNRNIINQSSSRTYYNNPPAVSPARYIQPIEKFEDVNLKMLDVPRLELSLEFLNQTTPSVKIHQLSELEKLMFEVKVRQSSTNSKRYLFDYSGKKISIERGLFIVTNNGKIYITYDRDHENAIKIRKENEEYVVAHYSFASVEDTGLTNVVFAGLITVVDGLPTKITNESGTFRPTMYQTSNFKSAFCKDYLQSTKESLGMDFFIDRFVNIEEQIAELMVYGYENECVKLVNQLQVAFNSSPIREYKQNIREYLDRIKKTMDAPAPHIQNINNKTKNINNKNNQTASKKEKQTMEFNNESLLCIVCQDSKRNVLFMPCKHINSCIKCCKPLTLCPECRLAIQSKIENVYIN
jgi:hypothetical protein